LLLRELPDELLVYDREQHRAHCLNRTAALVFRQADGTRSPSEIARLLDSGAPDAEQAVKLALAQLAEAGLLEERSLAGEPAAHEPGPALTRRDVVHRVGLAAAILLPAVATIVAPTPAEAAATCATSCAGKLPGTACCGGASSCVCPNCTAPACACDVSENCVG
jgi:hypothetical protein